jgi:hypothetical protein
MKIFLTIIGIISLAGLIIMLASVFSGTIEIKNTRAPETEQLPAAAQ